MIVSSLGCRRCSFSARHRGSCRQPFLEATPIHRESFAASDPPVGCMLGSQISRNRSAMRDASYPILSEPGCPPLRHGIRRFPINRFHCASIECRWPPWKQIANSIAPDNTLIYFRKFGAGEGIRTLDPNLG
ncbi:MAG: hypothetical protein ACREE2_05465, partial [Stellaceae bacterium]